MDFFPFDKSQLIGILLMSVGLLYLLMRKWVSKFSGWYYRTVFGVKNPNYHLYEIVAVIGGAIVFLVGVLVFLRMVPLRW